MSSAAPGDRASAAAAPSGSAGTAPARHTLDWNPAWLRQLWTRPTWRRRQWIDVEPPLPRPMAKHGPWTWSNPAGWHIRVCNYIFRRLRPLSVGPLFGPLPTSFVSARRIIRPGWNAKGPATAGFRIFPSGAIAHTRAPGGRISLRRHVPPSNYVRRAQGTLRPRVH